MDVWINEFGWSWKDVQMNRWIHIDLDGWCWMVIDHYTLLNVVQPKLRNNYYDRLSSLIMYLIGFQMHR